MFRAERVDANKLEKLRNEVVENRALAEKDRSTLQAINIKVKKQSVIKEDLELQRDKLKHSVKYYQDKCEEMKIKYNELETILNNTEMAVTSNKRRLITPIKTNKDMPQNEDVDVSPIMTDGLQHQVQVLESEFIKNNQIITELITDLNLNNITT